jgi:hypothetical protein
MAVTEVGPQPATASSGAPWTKTTRLLCAAAYTDATLAQEAVEELLKEEHRAVEVPPGVDPEPVLKHCLAAYGHKRRRDRVLVADLIFLVSYILVAGGPFALGFSLALAGVAHVAARAATGPARPLRWWSTAYLLGAVASLLVSVLFIPTNAVIALGVSLAWGTIAYDVWRANYHVVTKQLNARAFDPDAAPPVEDSDDVRRIHEIVERQAGNLTVYSGFLPFARAGRDLGGWSFVVDLRKGRERMGQRVEPTAVESLELYEGVEDALRGLRMSNLTIEDRAYVNGADVRGDAALLPSPTSRPSSSVADVELRRLMVAPEHRIRHYTCIRVTDWGGELVLSLYLRFGIANGRLFCELSSVLLTPLKPELHLSDGISPEPELEDLMRLAWRSLVLTPPLWFRSPYAVLRPLIRDRRRRRELRNIRRDVLFDYGAGETVLDRVRSPYYERYFQKLDKEMYAKVLERAILDSIVDVLEAHDVDAGELVERRSTIINNGLMFQGGSLEAKNVAVGSGAGVFDRSSGGGAATASGSAGGVDPGV